VKRLRVAVVSDALYPWHKGGKEVRYLHLLNHLPDHGMDVVVYSMKWWGDDAPSVSTPFGSLAYKALCPRVPMYRGSRRSIFQAVLFALSTLRLLAYAFDAIEADHMPYLQLIPLRIVAWVKRVPLVITWHEVWGKDGWRTYIGRVGFAAALIERVCIHLPDTIVAVSSGTAEKLIVMGASRKKIFVVPNAIDLDQLFATAPNPSAPDLLFVGRLIDHKHADIAIEATRILSSRGLDVHLGVVGAGPEESSLRAQVSQANLEDRITFYLNIDSQLELWSLIRGSRVLLAPSIREGFGILVAESLALGTPVVCALHPENESSKMIRPGTGSVVAPLDAVALADAAEYWLNDTSHRDDRRSVFIAESEKYTFDAMVNSYAELLRIVA
jgi:glycosyltransferase involved in cell wall biosynthesis